MTSRDVVNVAQRRLRTEWNRRDVKVGHAGTLDPLAEGVLVLAIGSASRLVPYVQQQPKHYRATFRLGQSTQSGDLEGEVESFPNLPQPTENQIRQAASQLIGRIEQTPPAHSAVWVDGQRAYRRIRAGETFEMPKRTVDVYSLEVTRYQFPEVDLDIQCGSGTYVRTLGIDLAVAAGSVAVMSFLQRVGIGPFRIDSAWSIDQLREEDFVSALLPTAMGVMHLQSLTVDEQQSQRLGHGLGLAAERPHENGDSDWAAMTDDGQLRAIVRWKKDGWYPYRVFPVG